MAKKKPKNEVYSTDDVNEVEPSFSDGVDPTEAPSEEPAPSEPKPMPASEKRPPDGYENHPKFAKFKKGT